LRFAANSRLRLFAPWLSFGSLGHSTSHNNKHKTQKSMSKQELRDKRGSLIGTVAIQSSGKHEGRDARGSLKGTYDPKSNETRDSRGSLVGKGDLLSSLITSTLD
jgi:hypothetical protein